LNLSFSSLLFELGSQTIRSVHDLPFYYSYVRVVHSNLPTTLSYTNLEKNEGKK